MKRLPYSERLKACQIATLHYRRTRGDMIETYKIITGKYQDCVAPSLIKEENYVTRGNDFRLQKLEVRHDLHKSGFSNQVVNHGIVYLTGLFLLIPLTHLKLYWINVGTVKILYMILEHSCREPEVVVKCCVRNFCNLVYCKESDFKMWAKRFRPALVNSVYVYVYVYVLTVKSRDKSFLVESD